MQIMLSTEHSVFQNPICDVIDTVNLESAANISEIEDTDFKEYDPIESMDINDQINLIRSKYYTR